MITSTLTEPALAVRMADLKAIIPALSRVIRGRVTLPILGMVKVQTFPAKQSLKLSATDLNLSVRVEVPCLYEFEEREAFLVQMADLQRVVKTASHSRAGIDLRSLRADEDVREFPEDLQLKQAVTIHLDATEVESLFHAFTCVSEDQTRYVICGVYLDPAEGGKMVATDGRHLVCFDAPALTTLKQPCILPDHRLWSWRGFRESGGCTLHLGTFGKSDEESPGFQMEGEGWSVIGKGIEGAFPNYRQVIPSASQFVTRVELGQQGCKALAEKLEQLGRWKDTPLGVGLRIEKNELHLLHREKADQAFLETDLSVARVSGPEMTVILSREYLIKAPRFGFDRIHLIDPCSPVRFSGESGLLIVMPIRLADPQPTPPAPAAEQGDGESSLEAAASPEPQLQEPEPQPEQPKTRTNMKPTNGTHPASSATNGNGNGNGNGGHSAPSNGHRVSRAPALEGEDSNGSDPMDAAVQQLAQLRETLKGALNGMVELSATLKTVRQQQKDTEREIRTVRSTIRSLKDIRL